MEEYEKFKAMMSEKFRPTLKKFRRGEMSEKELEEELRNLCATTHLGNLEQHPLHFHPADLEARTQLLDKFFVLCLQDGD